MAGRVVHLQGNYKSLLSKALNTAATVQGFKNVLFIDAENCFDSNYLREFLGIDPAILRNITVGFPTSAADFSYMVYSKLEKQLLVDNIKVLFISGVELFTRDAQSKYLVAKALDKIRDLSVRYGLTAILLSYGSSLEDPQLVVLDDLRTQALKAITNTVEEVATNAS